MSNTPKLAVAIKKLQEQAQAMGVRITEVTATSADTLELFNIHGLTVDNTGMYIYGVKVKTKDAPTTTQIP